MIFYVLAFVSGKMSGNRVLPRCERPCYIGMPIVMEVPAIDDGGEVLVVKKGRVVDISSNDTLDVSVEVKFGDDEPTKWMKSDEWKACAPSNLVIKLPSNPDVYLDVEDFPYVGASGTFRRKLVELNIHAPPNDNNILDRRGEWGFSVEKLQIACSYLAPEKHEHRIPEHQLRWLIKIFTLLEFPKGLANCDTAMHSVVAARISSVDKLLSSTEQLYPYELPQSLRVCTDALRRELNRPNIDRFTFQRVERLFELMRNSDEVRNAVWSSLVYLLPPLLQKRPVPQLLLNRDTPHWVYHSMCFYCRKNEVEAVIEEEGNVRLKRKLKANRKCGPMFPREWE
jgi:hypothetical protein